MSVALRRRTEYTPGPDASESARRYEDDDSALSSDSVAVSPGGRVNSSKSLASTFASGVEAVKFNVHCDATVTSGTLATSASELGRQYVAPEDEKCPGGHAVHGAPPPLLYVFAAQAVHAAAEVAPVDNTYFPASQFEHTEADDAPTMELYFPAAHAVHVETDVAPTAVLNRPAAHGEHVPALDALLAALYEPAAHDTHVADEVAPPAPLYVPGVQSTHADRITSLYFPAVHCEHTVTAPDAATEPATQGLHADAPVSAFVALPGAHSKHELIDEAPAVGL